MARPAPAMEAGFETGDGPLVSCVLPTADRRPFVAQAVHYFERQDYPHRELIVVDDGEDPIEDLLPASPRIRYLALPRKHSVGAKRELGCRIARGEILAHWDDDDWYAPERLRLQIAPLLAGEADLSGLPASVVFEVDRWRFWSPSRALHRRLFAGDVAGGTLVFRRRVWRELARYPDTSLAEDAGFLCAALRRGARLAKIPHAGLFLYVRHGRNTWSFACDRDGWESVAEPDLPSDDRAFYARRSVAAPPAPPPSDPAEHPEHTERRIWQPRGPRVSCLMPTADRAEWVQQAVRCFQRQDYPQRELVIVDDGVQSVAGLLPTDSRIRYHRTEPGRSLGAKRNLACELACGEILCHWDDDDWHAPWRLRYQVRSLLAAEADVCGLDRLLFYEPAAGRLWRYVHPQGQAPWLAGGTFCYRRTLWQRCPFPDLDIGEDNAFLTHAGRPGRVLALDDPRFYLARIHPGNTSPKNPVGRRWQSLDPGELAGILEDDLLRKDLR